MKTPGQNSPEKIRWIIKSVLFLILLYIIPPKAQAKNKSPCPLDIPPIRGDTANPRGVFSPNTPQLFVQNNIDDSRAAVTAAAVFASGEKRRRDAADEDRSPDYIVFGA